MGHNDRINIIFIVLGYAEMRCRVSWAVIVNLKYNDEVIRSNGNIPTFLLVLSLGFVKKVSIFTPK